jgi:hypothetical protein
VGQVQLRHVGQVTARLYSALQPIIGGDTQEVCIVPDLFFPAQIKLLTGLCFKFLAKTLQK